MGPRSKLGVSSRPAYSSLGVYTLHNGRGCARDGRESARPPHARPVGRHTPGLRTLEQRRSIQRRRGTEQLRSVRVPRVRGEGWGVVQSAAPSSCATVHGRYPRVRDGASGALALLVRATRKARANEQVQTPGLVLGAGAASGRVMVVRWVKVERAGAKTPSFGVLQHCLRVASELLRGEWAS